MKLEATDRYMGLRRTQTALMVLAWVGLSACTSMKGIESQAVLRDAASLGMPTDPVAVVSPDSSWWRELGDDQLNRLVDLALLNHPSLHIARARLVRAQAGVAGTEALAGPQLVGGLDAMRQQYTANGAVPPPLAGTVRESGTAQLTGSWELDFFGKNRVALDAALGTVRAAQADADAARTLLASQVARGYLQWLRLNEQLVVAQRVLAQRTQALSLVQDRVKAGLDTTLELRQSEATLPEARLQIETLQEQLALAHNALNALLGQPNRPLALIDKAQAAIKIIAFPAVLPSDLLGRRADIAAARWRVEAATQDVSHAQAQFYPSINLNAFAGFSSIGLDRLLGAGSEQWGLGPALRLPLFDGGRLRANLSVKTADLDAAIESYNATVIEGIHEVADQLVARQAITRQQAEQGAAQALAEKSYAIAVQRYDTGLSNRLSVLAAETQVLSQRRLAVDLAARALDTQVSLMRALGGGYRADLPAIATATAAHP